MLVAELAAVGHRFRRCSLSRTPKEAWEGTLDTMIGANDAVFQRVKPMIETGRKIVHVGGVGDGHCMKLLNNFLGMALTPCALLGSACGGGQGRDFTPTF